MEQGENRANRVGQVAGEYRTSRVTTDPAATTAFSPMFTPGSTVEFEPIQALAPIFIGLGYKSCRLSASKPWFNVASTTPCPMSTPSPISIPPWSWNLQPALMNTPLPSFMFLPQSV